MSLCADNISIEVSAGTSCKRLVSNVSLSIESGELVVIVGPNGAGKSSLLKALCGDFPLSAGEIYLYGKPLQQWKPIDIAQIRAILPQHTHLAFSFAVNEVVQMGRVPHRFHSTAKQDREAVDIAMQLADVTHLKHRDYSGLSGGEAQRVQFARVLAQLHDSETPLHERYLFLDEPTASLDPQHQHATLNVARQLAQQNIGVCAVLHDLNMASLYADRILVMREGLLELTGTPWDVLTEQHVSNIFSLPVDVIPHPVIDCPLVVQSSY